MKAKRCIICTHSGEFVPRLIRTIDRVNKLKQRCILSTIYEMIDEQHKQSSFLPLIDHSAFLLLFSYCICVANALGASQIDQVESTGGFHDYQV